MSSLSAVRPGARIGCSISTVMEHSALLRPNVTDVLPPDAFLEASAGRAPFRLADLLELRERLDRHSAKKAGIDPCKGNFVDRVIINMPYSGRKQTGCPAAVHASYRDTYKQYLDSSIDDVIDLLLPRQRNWTAAEHSTRTRKRSSIRSSKTTLSSTLGIFCKPATRCCVGIASKVSRSWR